MSRVNLFADESGNFDFSRQQGASEYFILTTITQTGYSVGDALLELRRELVWEDLGLREELHASENSWPIRNRVFDTLEEHDFRVDATILEKSKAEPQIRPTNRRFYKHAWYFHLKYVVPRVTGPTDDLLVVGASLGTSSKRKAMHNAVKDVVQQVSPTMNYRTASWRANSDPCLAVADYCCWAIARKWEQGKTGAYDRIKEKIKSEFDVFERGDTHHY